MTLLVAYLRVFLYAGVLATYSQVPHPALAATSPKTAREQIALADPNKPSRRTADILFRPASHRDAPKRDLFIIEPPPSHLFCVPHFNADSGGAWSNPTSRPCYWPASLLIARSRHATGSARA